MFRKSISSVLIATVALAVILAVAAIVTYVSRSTYGLALDQQKQAMTQMTNACQRGLDVYMDGVRSMVGTLAARRSMQEALAGDAVRAEADLKQYLAANSKTIWGALLFNTEGLVVAGSTSSGESLAGQNRSERAYVKAIQGGQALYMPKDLLQVELGGSKALTFPIAQAVKGPEGKIIGGVCLFPLWEEYTKAFIDPPRFGDRGYGFMLAADGTIIGHAVDRSLLLKNLTEHEFIRQALEIKNGDLFYDWKGEQKYMVVSTDPDTGWKVCMSAYVTELTATATNQRNVLLGIGAAAVLVLVGAIMFAISRLVVRPLREIEGFTAAIAKGDFKAVLATHFKFEMKSLAGNIRTMVAELKQKLGFAQGVLDGFVLPCAVFDKDNKATFINSHMMDALDRTDDPQAQYGKTSGGFFYGEESRETLTLKALREKRRLDSEVEYTTARNVAKVFNVTSTPINDLDGNLLGVLAVWFELTEIRAQQKKIEAQNQKIAEAATAANTVSDQVASASE
ncbi:MAG TPA: chemotaxis protein, partial [Desulfovibrio sp.]|nr:chemotaxis protein [Desulfovibrio sp.]